jgi:2-haloalkanoic acid dehalogenase type II
MKALLFDACDILYHRPGYEQKLDAFFGPDRRRVQQLKASSFTELQTLSARGKISVAAMFDGMMSLYGLPPSRYAEGRRFLKDAMADVVFFDGVREGLRQLKEDGFKLAVITNSFQSSQTKLDWFAKAGIDGVWDAFVSSSESGDFKPEPGIYKAALEKLGCKPSEAAYVAHAANELEGARAVGLTTIAFNRDDPSVRADYVIEHFSELPGLARRLRDG